jgi:hypothetical protein
MIQRIQTIWLLLAAVAILGLFALPTFTLQHEGVSYALTALGQKSSAAPQANSTHILLAISTAMAALISISNVFNFRNRAFQKRIAFANMLLLVLLSFWFSQLGKSFPVAPKLGFGMVLPPLAIVFTFLAIRGIKNDEKLVRSADRLR